MPNDLVKSYADKTNKSVDEVEKIWNEAKAQAHDKFGEESDSFWAYVNAIVQKRLGLNESNDSFIKGCRGLYDFRVVCNETNNTPEVIVRAESKKISFSEFLASEHNPFKTC